MRLFKGQIKVRETDKINVQEDWLEVRDKNGNKFYYESGEFWVKREFDKNGNVTYYESDKYWEKREYDKNKKEIYYEDSNKFWSKQEFDKNGNRTYYENSNGKIIDNRLKEITIEQQKKKDELLDLYRLMNELKETVAFEVKLLDREKAIQDILDISIKIYLIETELKG